MNLTKKSIKVLKSLQLSNGGILATPSNGAYPYVYTRDGVIATKAFNKAGLYKNSEKFYYFLNKYSRINQFEEMFHRFHAQGQPCVTRKRENDNLGLVVHGIYDIYTYTEDTVFLESMWLFINSCIKAIFNFSKTGLFHTERSIHEFYRLENGYEIWANSTACRALYDASEIAQILNHEKESKKWKLKAEIIEENIKKHLFNKKLKIFMKNKKHPNILDSSQLAPFYFNIIDSKSILKNTMKYLWKHIWHHDIGGFGRFRKFEVCKDWHWYTGGSGSWSVFTIWGAKFSRELKDKKGYNKCVKWINQTSSRSNGLLPEHIATREEYDLWRKNEIEFNSRILKGMKKTEQLSNTYKDNVMYWALPLAWSHAEYILLK